MSVVKPKLVLVTGASGLLGRAVMRKFKQAPNSEWKAVGLAYSRAENDLNKVNLLDSEALRKCILEHKPNVIVHCAAERNCNNVDRDYDSAFNLNVMASKTIAEVAGEISATLIYISTDYVFDGTNPPYKETHIPNPLNKYGQSKLEGEKVTLEACKGSCILRVPVLYGEVEHLQESVVTGLVANLLDLSTPSTISDYEIRYPTYVNDVAEICFRVSEKVLMDRTNKVRGIFHCSGRDSLTKYGMLKTISNVMDLPMHHIHADSQPTQGAPKPYDSHLDSSRLDLLVGEPYTSFYDGIKECLMEYSKESMMKI